MRATRHRAHGKVLRVGQAGAGDQLINVMLVIVIATAIGFIGTDVNEQINDSIELEDRPNNTFADAQDNLSGGYNDAMGLTDIVFIVLMFSVILGSLLVFRVRT